MRNKSWYTIDKQEAMILTVLMVGVVLYTDILNISHWIKTGFDLTSYNPNVPIIGIASTWAALLFLLRKLHHVSFPIAIPLIIGLVYSIIQIYGIFQSYPELYIDLRNKLIAVIGIMAVITWGVTKD